MALRCPKCRSSRVRRGYEKPSLILRLVGIHGLLCDSCNLSYRGFAVPGTVPKQSKRNYKKNAKPADLIELEADQPDEEQQGVKYARRVWPEDEGTKVGEVMTFAWYYVKLRVRAASAMTRQSTPGSR